MIKPSPPVCSRVMDDVSIALDHGLTKSLVQLPTSTCVTQESFWAELQQEAMDVAIHPLSLQYSDPEVELEFQDRKAHLVYAYSDPASFAVALLAYAAVLPFVMPHLEPFSTGWLLTLFYPVYSVKLACVRYFSSEAYYKKQRQDMLLVCKVITDVTAVVALQYWAAPVAAASGQSSIVHAIILQSGIIPMMWHCFSFPVPFKPQFFLQTTLLAGSVAAANPKICQALAKQPAGKDIITHAWDLVLKVCTASIALGRPAVFASPLSVPGQQSRCHLSVFSLQLTAGWMLPLAIRYYVELWAREHFLRHVAQRPQAVVFHTAFAAKAMLAVTLACIMGSTVVLWEVAVFMLLSMGWA